MTLRIEVVSIAYAGGDIGDDIRASFKVGGKLSQKTFTLAKGKTWTPPARWVLMNDTKAPGAAGSTVKILVQITERDVFIDDVGASTFTFTVPKHSFRDKTFTQTVTVKEDSVTATFKVTFKIRCIHLLFETLWMNHPTTRGTNDPCQSAGKSNFENQCAIRMGLTLERSGISLSAFNGARCWHGHGREHVLRVEELATWLQSQTTKLGTPVTHHSVTNADFTNKLGIAAFINFWGRGNQGDHIDLWNGKIVRKGDPNYFQRSERVVFWQL